MQGAQLGDSQLRGGGPEVEGSRLSLQGCGCKLPPSLAAASPGGRCLAESGSFSVYVTHELVSGTCPGAASLPHGCSQASLPMPCLSAVWVRGCIPSPPKFSPAARVTADLGALQPPPLLSTRSRWEALSCPAASPARYSAPERHPCPPDSAESPPLPPPRHIVPGGWGLASSGGALYCQGASWPPCCLVLCANRSRDCPFWPLTASRALPTCRGHEGS